MPSRPGGSCCNTCALGFSWQWTRTSNFLWKKKSLHLTKPFLLFQDAKGHPASLQQWLWCSLAVDTVAIARCLWGDCCTSVPPAFPFQAHLLGEVPDRADDGEKRGCLAAADLVPELAGDGRRGRQDVSEQRQQQQQGLLRQEQEGPTPPAQKESGRLERAQGSGILDTQERGVTSSCRNTWYILHVAEPGHLFCRFCQAWCVFRGNTITAPCSCLSWPKLAIRMVKSC